MAEQGWDDINTKEKAQGRGRASFRDLNDHSGALARSISGSAWHLLSFSLQKAVVREAAGAETGDRALPGSLSLMPVSSGH